MLILSSDWSGEASHAAGHESLPHRDDGAVLAGAGVDCQDHAVSPQQEGGPMTRGEPRRHNNVNMIHNDCQDSTVNGVNTKLCHRAIFIISSRIVSSSSASTMQHHYE